MWSNDKAFKGITIVHESPLRELSLRENKEVDSSWTELFNALCILVSKMNLYSLKQLIFVSTHTHKPIALPLLRTHGVIMFTTFMAHIARY